MAILTDVDLRKRVSDGSILIEPYTESLQLQPSSIDVRLGHDFRTFTHSRKEFIDPLKDTDALNDYTEVVSVEEGKPFIFHPGEFILGRTLERVRVPSDLVARLDGRSSIGRLALIIHATAGYIDPGFDGTITLEMVNLGKMPVALYPGQRIGQLVFETCTSPAEKPYGHKDLKSKYMNQVLPEASKVLQDRERDGSVKE